MNDDQAIIDAINSVVDDYSTGDTKAPRILAALRSAGFQVFRPDECEPMKYAPEGALKYQWAYVVPTGTEVGTGGIE